MWYNVDIFNIVEHPLLSVYLLLPLLALGGEGSILGGAGAVIGIGSDIGGSIRMPCFFNGIFGHKTTPGKRKLLLHSW